MRDQFLPVALNGYDKVGIASFLVGLPVQLDGIGKPNNVNTFKTFSTCCSNGVRMSAGCACS
jgi:hypothetical protein